MKPTRVENNIERVLSEIKDIMYILHDEGIVTHIQIENNPLRGQYIIISVNCYDGEYESDLDNNKILKSDYYKEFIERVSSIGESNGLSVCFDSSCHVYIHKNNDWWIRSMDTHFRKFNNKYWIDNNSNERMKHLKRLTEVIKLDIKVGDIVMGGRFKNKKIKVKKIGKNKKGDLCINGKPLLRFRIVDQEKLNEKVEYHGTLGISKAYDDMVSLAKEIDDEIMYIMNDINVYPEMNIRYNQGGINGAKTDRAWIDINFDKKYAETEEYLEFLDRMNDIAKSHGCRIAHEEDRYGYILVYDPKTIDRSRWQIPMKVMESNENKFSINNLKKEIEELNYILEDENIQLSGNPEFFGINIRNGIMTGDYIHIPFYVPINRWNDILSGGEDGFFIEYLNRVSEVASRYNYILFIQKDLMNIRIVHPGYIYWRDNMKNNISPKILNQ